MTKPKIIARKWMGDDAGSWAVFIDGQVFVSGLTKREVPYYKQQALKVYTDRVNRQISISEVLDNEPEIPEGIIDHDDEDRRAHCEELNVRTLPSEY
jgi:hypothetical protein